MKDTFTGISMRFIQQYDIKRDQRSTPIDFALVSCSRFGHTFVHNNQDEPYCGVCGMPKPKPEAGA